MVTRRDRIILLLDFYCDVRDGFRDPPNGGGDGISRLGSTWSGAEYSQLRSLLQEMRSLSPLAYRNLVGFYIGATYVRRARCPRCGGVFAPSAEAKTQHCDGDQHGRRYGRAVVLESYMLKVIPEFTIMRLVRLGERWLDERWQGECDLPSEIRDVLHARQVEALKRGKPMETSVVAG